MAMLSSRPAQAQSKRGKADWIQFFRLVEIEAIAEHLDEPLLAADDIVIAVLVALGHVAGHQWCSRFRCP